MKEYIERAALKRELAPYEENDFSQQMDVILAIVDAQPAADVAPVRHGRWMRIYEDGEPAIEQHQVGVCCSKCMKMPKDKFTESDYCPNCGAKMDL